MKRLIAPEAVVAFWKYMNRKYGTVTIAKADAHEMKLVAATLALMGIMDVRKFMSRYTTTVGNRIYVPFEIGEADDAPLIDQVAICVHEHVHHTQFATDEFVPEYCLSSSKRALHECAAYRASMEIAFWFTGRCPNPETVAKKLKAYACTEEDIAVATKYLTAAAAVIKAGGIITRESQVAIPWLEKHTEEA